MSILKTVQNPEIKKHSKKYKRGEIIPLETEDVGIVLSGAVNVYKNDLSGGVTIVEYIESGELIGEASGILYLPDEEVTYICSKETEIVYFDYIKALKNEAAAKEFIVLMSKKENKFRQRAAVLCARSIRDKLLCCFETFYINNGRKSFKMPFSMVALADYISADRSAMTRELRKMKNEGILKIEKHIVTGCWEN